MPIQAIIFDFDGVIADSEALANIVLAEHVTALGLPTTLDDALSRYMGKRWGEFLDIVEGELGKPLPKTFSDDLKAATLARFEVDLMEVRGAAAFIREYSDLSRCIASSSSLDRLQLCLSVLGLAAEFEGAVFSADMVQRGKPHPDIFLHAAEQLGMSPVECLVIEDSSSGVKAGVAAGMSVVGLCAGSHVRGGHADRLKAAGATYIAESWDEVSSVVLKLKNSDGQRTNPTHRPPPSDID